MPKPTVKRPGRTQRISERLSSESDSRPSSSSTPQPTKVEKKQTRDDGDSNLRVLLLNDRLVTQKEMFCPLCDVLKPNGEEIFRTREAFAIHFRKYHADVELILSCGVCDQSFGTAKQLAEHLDLHDANGDVPQEISIDSDVDSDVEVIESAKKTMKKSPKFSQYPSMEKSDNIWSCQNEIEEVSGIKVGAEYETDTPHSAISLMNIKSSGKTPNKSKRKANSQSAEKSSGQKLRLSFESPERNETPQSMKSERSVKTTLSCLICHEMMSIDQIQSHYISSHLSMADSKRGVEKSPMKECGNEEFKRVVAKVLAKTDVLRDESGALKTLQAALEVVNKLLE